MLFIDFYALGALLLLFIRTTWAGDCYSSGYKFSDLLEDADFNSTMKDFCRIHAGTEVKNGDSVSKIGSNTEPRLQKQCIDR